MNGYPGGKGQAGVFQRIIGQMRPHSIYVEACVGSGQVFFRKRPAAHSIVIDSNAAVIAGLSKARLPGLRAICGDAISVLPTLALGSGAVVYCDPPYLLETRGRPGRNYYGEHEMSREHHAALLAMLQGLKCDVLISHYPCQLYNSQLRDWRCLSYRTRTRGRTVTENLWCNFPEPVELHDWRYAGNNFRERLYLKRLAARWVTNLSEMPARKRGYVLHEIHQRQF